MADSKTLKILLVEDNLEDEQFLCEALIEIEENLQWCNWRTSSIVQVDQLADALYCLRRDTFDVILLNLSLPDSPVLLDSFLEASACVRGAPIVVLADEEDEHLANRLLREGAQDVLLKSQLECAPLARSMRYAVERQRRANALEASATLDDLTGALKPLAFVATAEHLAQFAQAGLVTASFELFGIPEATQDDREARDLILIRTAETLRRAFPEPLLLGRVDRSRFGLVIAGLNQSAAEARLDRAAIGIEEVAKEYGRHSASIRFSVASLDTGDIERQFAALNCSGAVTSAGSRN